MASSSTNLFSSSKIGDLIIKNRMALAPMTRSRCGEEQLANDLTRKYYVQRAGAGLVITEGAIISRQANGWWQAPAIYREQDVVAWKPVVDAVKAAGTVFFCQLWHCGRASHSDFFDGKERAVAPSAIKAAGVVHTPKGKKETETPRALKTEELADVVQEYVQAAKTAKAAGFDGIEIHSANGYLLDTFLQEKTNQRTDAYGGSIENRFRLLKEVLEAVSKVYPSNRVGVHLSPNGNYNDMGSKSFREQFTYIASQLNKMNLAYIHIVDGLTFGFHQLGEPVKLEEFRKVYKGIIIGNCGYTKETAEKEIKEGNADLISFGRPFISNPDLPRRFQENLPLNPLSDVATWFGPPASEKGYTDFPTYDEAPIAAAN